MATPCRAYGCPNVVKSRLQKGYCDEHADKRYGWLNNKTPDKDYGGRRWRKMREQVLERDGYLCVKCRDDGRLTQATDVDHIKPVHLGRDDSLSNLQSLCKTCHKAKTETERSG